MFSFHVSGVEFMMTSQAYFCTLCKTFSGDNMCAELHLKSDEHNEAFRVSSTMPVFHLNHLY
jgi:hypothetical protein